MRKSGNMKILGDIRSRMRRAEITPEMSYLIIYAFLYKYCSDLLKDYFLESLKEKEMTLDEAFADEYTKMLLQTDADHMFGYFITGPDYFIDEVINAKYSDRFFIYEFVDAFSSNVEFVEGSKYEEYFNFIFNAFKQDVNLKKFEFEGENHLVVKEIIFMISKLDIYEENYSFQDVFSQICQPRLLNVNQDPDYLNAILSAIVKASKVNMNYIYNPCLKDASSVIALADNVGIGVRAYGRCQDRLTYCTAIVKLLINHFDLDIVKIDSTSPFGESAFKEESFDVIVSNLPAITSRNIQRLNKKQNEELVKRKKAKQLQDMLSNTLNIDETSFANDDELKNTLRTLVDRMDTKEAETVRFMGEYEELNDSEYLFLINLLDNLKDDGIMVLAMSQSFLFKQSLQKLRKYLTDELNCIDAVISIPDELSRPKRSQIIVVFRKNKNIDDIVFIDMSNEFKLKASKKAAPGLFKRNLVLDDETLNKVLWAYCKRRKIDKFSSVVNHFEIAKNEFNLSISRYVDTFEGEFIRFEDLKNEKKEITSRIKVLNEKIDRMMDDLGLRF